MSSPTVTKDDTPLHSPKTSPTMRSKMEKTAAGSSLRWAFSYLLLLTPGLMMVSGVGANCVGSLVAPRPGEALLICPLTEDVNQTKHSIVIRHFPYKGDTVKVFQCVWLKKDPDYPDCRSYHDFTLVSLEKDCVAASIPQTQLHKNGSFKCQLVPPDDDQPFTRCLVFNSDVAEDPPTTISDQPQPSDPTGANADHPEGLVVAVALSCTVLILLIVIFMVVILLLFRRYLKGGTSVIFGIETPVSASRGEEGHDVTSEGSDTPINRSNESFSSTESEKHLGSPLLEKDKKPANGP